MKCPRCGSTNTALVERHPEYYACRNCQKLFTKDQTPASLAKEAEEHSDGSTG